MNHLFVEANGLRFHALAAGPSGGRLVILLHGFPEYSRSWRHQLPALARAGYRAVAPDLRGYAQTDKRGPYDLATLVEDLAALVRALGHERAALVGHDWGGAIAWMAAHRRPEVVERLAVLNAPHPATIAREVFHNPRQLARSSYVLAFLVPRLPERLLTARRARAVATILRAGAHVKSAWPPEELERYRQAFLEPGAAGAALGYYRALARRPRWIHRVAEHHPIDVPVLLLWGLEDRAVGEEFADPERLEPWLGRENRPAIQRFEGVGHFVQNEAPGPVTDALLARPRRIALARAKGGTLPRMADVPGSRLSVAPPRPDVSHLLEATAVAERLVRNVERVVRGKRDEVVLVLTALACRGHVLFEDVPGTAKTVLARSIAQSIEGARTTRIQCTPDLQPTDVTGLGIFNQKTREFEFRPGPIFANIVLVDEINRAMPKTQSALLEAMAERQVTVDGATRPLPDPFLLLATENPIEQEGTYLLPEAQLDRFFLCTALGYPGAADELRIVRDQRHGHPLADVAPVVALADVTELQRRVEDVYVDEVLQSWIVDLVRATRELDTVEVGASVRGSLALERAARARALLSGREYVVPEDVEALFVPVIGHRVLFAPAFFTATRGLARNEALARFRDRCLEVAPRPAPPRLDSP